MIVEMYDDEMTVINLRNLLSVADLSSEVSRAVMSNNVSNNVWSPFLATSKGSAQLAQEFSIVYNT